MSSEKKSNDDSAVLDGGDKLKDVKEGLLNLNGGRVSHAIDAIVDKLDKKVFIDLAERGPHISGDREVGESDEKIN